MQAIGETGAQTREWRPRRQIPRSCAALWNAGLCLALVAGCGSSPDPDGGVPGDLDVVVDAGAQDMSAPDGGAVLELQFGFTRRDAYYIDDRISFMVQAASGRAPYSYTWSLDGDVEAQNLSTEDAFDYFERTDFDAGSREICVQVVDADGISGSSCDQVMFYVPVTLAIEPSPPAVFCRSTGDIVLSIAPQEPGVVEPVSTVLDITSLSAGFEPMRFVDPTGDVTVDFSAVPLGTYWISRSGRDGLDSADSFRSIRYFVEVEDC